MNHILPTYDVNRLPDKEYFGKRQCFTVKNGFCLEKPRFDSMSAADEVSGITFDPVLAYGIVQKPKIESFRPNYVKYAKMNLLFRGYILPSKINIPGCTVRDNESHETNRDHKCEIALVYYLEDDTVQINRKNPYSETYGKKI